MEIYLVGGAIRDQLLEIPISEKDWVVVGSTPEKMVALGYRPVGKDFPVFLHPETQEEYALARTERKIKKGYTGFEFYTSPLVTLEEDLMRRDLTINAMAQTLDGKIIDPFHGKKDLQDKILRHVSPAFTEDPVRILRVARFAARYAHLGFSIAPETIMLMRKMVTNGEVNALVAERVWQETVKALQEKSPHIFFMSLRTCGALKKIFPELDNLFGIPAKPQWHPEIDTGIHVMMVLMQAAELTLDPATRFAALMHDLGKGESKLTHWPSHIDHEKKGLNLIKLLCKRLRIPSEYRDLALLASQYHTHVHKVFELKPKTLLDTLSHLDAFRRPHRFCQFLLACKADFRGRAGFENRPYPQHDYFQQAFTEAKSVSTKTFDHTGLSGLQIAEKLRLLRLKALKEFVGNSKLHR